MYDTESPLVSRILLTPCLLSRGSKKRAGNHSSRPAVTDGLERSTWKTPKEPLGEIFRSHASRFDLAPRRAYRISLQQLRSQFPDFRPFRFAKAKSNALYFLSVVLVRDFARG